MKYVILRKDCKKNNQNRIDGTKQPKQIKYVFKVSSLWPGVRGDCYSLLLEWDYGNGMWVDFDCSSAMAFVCVKRGINMYIIYMYRKSVL